MMILSRNTAVLAVVASIGLIVFLFSFYVQQMRDITAESNTNMLGALGQMFADKEAKALPQPIPALVTAPPQPPVLCTAAPEYNFEDADQLDPKLIEYIRKEVLIPPSPHDYSLQNPEAIHFSQHGQSQHANKKYFHGMRGGFFVEVGAIDGERLSNTLFFERQLGWRGLLIEASPERFGDLFVKGRNAYIVNAALAITTKAGYVNFDFNAITSGNGTKVKSFPLISLLLALDVEVVDFLSLDIESFEVKVLKTIPWDRIKFRLMCIEVNHIPEGAAYLAKFLREKGYVFLEKKEIDHWYGHPDLLPIKRKG